jgi:hypothetical protein
VWEKAWCEEAGALWLACPVPPPSTTTAASAAAMAMRMLVM